MLDIGEKILEILGKLVPPDDADPAKHRSWRLWIAGMTIVNALGLSAHILLACGYIPFYPGFAQAGEINTLKAQMESNAAAIRVQVSQSTGAIEARMAVAEADRKAQRISTLKKEILDLQLKRCTTPAGPVKAMYTSAIQDMLVEYQALTETAYPLPGCDSF